MPDFERNGAGLGAALASTLATEEGNGDESRLGIDPITREIIHNALSTAGNEMAVAMFRTSYSTILRDCLDYATSLCNVQGEMIAQGTTLPLHLGSIPYAMEKLFEKFGGKMEQGDIYILNDPFDGGMHTPDIFIIKPIFWEGQHVAFAACTAHHMDIGGRLPGTSACDNTEIFQEGLRIPWLRLYHRGRPNETLFTLLRANVRIPQITLGDLQAQLAACNIGERAIHEIIRRYGVETFLACSTDIVDYTERLMRAEIATWPKGSKTFVDYIDSNGIESNWVKIQVTVTIDEDSIIFDFTGTDPQVPGAINCTESFTMSAAALAVRAMMREDVPNTAGMFRPIKIIAPKGSLVNVSPPGACSMRGVTGFRMVDAIYGALAGILPDRVFSAGEGGNTLLIIGGKHENAKPFVYYELFTGTWGARPGSDGNDGLCNPANVASNIPVEQAESEYPVFIERYGLVPDSGGAGQYRGGLAVERQWTLLHDEAHLLIRSDRRDHPPYGLYGGLPGAPSTNILFHDDGSRDILPTMISTTIRTGESIYHRMAGGGGWGDPLKRDPSRVVEDVSNGKVSVKHARELYGVVLNEATMVVDGPATVMLRKQMSQQKQ